MRKYGYKYDNLNRLQKAIYQKPNSTYPVTNMYNEELVYDMNGNIQHLKRNGDLDDPEASSVVQIDDLKYTYDDNKKNQLKEVTDSSTHPKGFTDDDNATNDTDYGYDDNGNLTSDLNKKIDKIRYNHLNLPTYIKFLVIGNIEYLYDATGQKVMKTVTDGTTVTQTDYLDGFQYTDSVLNFFPHAEGYVNVTYCAECAEGEKLKFDYVYHYVDHLGNVRVSYGLDRGTQELKILEENHYYPFGLKHTRYNSIRKQYDMDPFGTHTTINTTTDGLLNKYKFQGQERQDELGLNWDSFKWRNYDYAIGRFMSIDPLAEDYTHNSPYAFAENKVIRRVRRSFCKSNSTMEWCF